MSDALQDFVNNTSKQMTANLKGPVKILMGFVRKDLTDRGYSLPVGLTGVMSIWRDKEAREIVFRWANILSDKDDQRRTANAIAWIKEYIEEDERRANERTTTGGDAGPTETEQEQEL